MWKYTVPVLPVPTGARQVNTEQHFIHCNLKTHLMTVGKSSLVQMYPHSKASVVASLPRLTRVMMIQSYGKGIGKG
jgi:hypothetical protein